MAEGVRLGVDTGGTFTDLCLLHETTGRLAVTKVPSTPGNPADAVLTGIRTLLESEGIPPRGLRFLIHGTTVATLAMVLDIELFVIGGDLSAPGKTEYPVPRLADSATTHIENDIDRSESELPPLRNFILPGGHPGAAALHLARTICRRAERILVTLEEIDSVNPAIIPYVNRLSDLLFSLARWVNLRAGVADKPWISSSAL